MALINFLVIALMVFVIMRAIASRRRREEALAAPYPQAQMASALLTRLADALDRRQL